MVRGRGLSAAARGSRHLLSVSVTAFRPAPCRGLDVVLLNVTCLFQGRDG